MQSKCKGECFLCARVVLVANWEVQSIIYKFHTPLLLYPPVHNIPSNQFIYIHHPTLPLSFLGRECSYGSVVVIRYPLSVSDLLLYVLPCVVLISVKLLLSISEPRF